MTGDERRAIEADCARLIALYANLNDAARWAEAAALYAEDGVMARPTAPDAPLVGRAAILALFGAHRAEGFQQAGDRAGLADGRDAHGVEGGKVSGGGDLRQHIGFEGFEDRKSVV